MICPILRMFQSALHSPFRHGDPTCVTHNCAWWNVHEARCAVVSLSDNLAKITNAAEFADNVKLYSPAKRSTKP